jgi:hypothetical protein
MEASQNLKVEVPCDAEMPLLGINQGHEISMSKKICTPTFITALFT